MEKSSHASVETYRHSSNFPSDALRQLGLLSFVATTLACTSVAEQRRIDAFGDIGAGDFDSAAARMEACVEGRASDEERFLCYALLGDIRFQQNRWEPAADAYGAAFEIRDRIAAAEGFGLPSMESLAHWGWASWKAGRTEEALAAFQRGIANRERTMAGDVFTGVMYIGVARITAATGDSASSSEALAHATVGCTTDELRYFRPGDGRAPAAWYLPTEAWCELHHVCAAAGEPGARSIKTFAIDQGYVQREAELFADCEGTPTRR